MTDLDFDELDKEIQSLMEGREQAAPQHASMMHHSVFGGSSVQRTATTPQSAVNDDTVVAHDAGQSPVAPVVQPQPQVVKPSLAQTRRGQFMDMVSSASSVTTKQQSGAIREARLQRATRLTGVSSQAVGSNTQAMDAIVTRTSPDLSSSAPARGGPTAHTNYELASEPPLTGGTANEDSGRDTAVDLAIASSALAQSSVSEGRHDEVLSSHLEAQQEPADLLSDNDNASAFENAPVVASTPFLPNTKVEKRPLGGAAPINDDLLVLNNQRDDVMVVEQPNDTSVPSVHAPAWSPEPEPAAGVAPANTKDVTSELGNIKPHEVNESSFDAALASTPPVRDVTSIPKQYKEAPSSDEAEPSGSIYDTTSYHQPLQHPVEKKGGWQWVVWIIIILIIGAAAGVGFYWFTMMQ